jgi:Family of unknown function (DUF6636)
VLGLAAALSAQALGSGSARAARTFHFKSPSGNINCYGGATGVTCLLLHNSWKKLRPKPASCDLDWSPTDMSLFLDSRAKRWGASVGGCRGDIGPLCYAQDPCAVLRYGASITAASGGRGIRCTSRASGVTCIRFGGSAGVRGFRIAREGYVVLR